MKSLSLSQPHAIVMVGIPGSGKSTFAEKFSQTFNAPFIDLDKILPRARDESAADELLMLQLREAIRTKASLVIEADASSRIRRTELSKFLRAHDYEPLFVWVQTDMGTAKQRVAKAKKILPEQYAAVLKRFSPPHPSENAIVISGKHTYASQAKIILKHLSADRATQAVETPAPRRAGRITIQ
jgi:predicted kinase